MYKFDHVYPSLPGDGPVVVLYGELGTPQLVQLHEALAQKASRREIQYVLRHFVQVL